MFKVQDEFRVGKYLSLLLNAPPPATPYRKYRIGGKEYDIVPTYDVENTIAVESYESLLGKVVEFI